MISPTQVVQFECMCIIGVGSIGTMVSGAGGRWPKALCGRIVL